MWRPLAAECVHSVCTDCLAPSSSQHSTLSLIHFAAQHVHGLLTPHTQHLLSVMTSTMAAGDQKRGSPSPAVRP